MSSRDRTAEFAAKRESSIAMVLKENERIMNMFQVLSMNTNSKEKRKSSTGFFLGESHNPASVTTCNSCGDLFGSGWFLASKKNVCNNCGKVVCSKCFQQKLETENIRGDDVTVSVVVCDNCFKAVSKARQQSEFRKKTTLATSSPFSQFYEEMHILKEIIEKQLPRYKKAVKSVYNSKSPALSSALELDSSLNICLGDFEAGLRKLDTFKTTSPKQEALKKSIKASYILSVQVWLPEFKVMRKALQTSSKLSPTESPDPPPVPVLPSPNAPSIPGSTPPSFFSSLSNLKDKIKNATLPDAPKIENATLKNEPFISSIYPMGCPLSGGTITITAQNLTNEIIVKVSGVNAQLISKKGDTVVMRSPPLNEGMKNIEIYNSDGVGFILDGALVYSDAFFKEPDVLPSSTSSTPNKLFYGNNSPQAEDESRRSGFFKSFSTPSLTIEEMFENSSDQPKYNSDSNTKDEDIVPLSLVGLNPVVSPLGGARITITLNRSVSDDVVVKVGGVVVKREFVNKEKSSFCFQSPPMKQGFKTIEILDPRLNGRRGSNELILEEMLHYDEKLSNYNNAPDSNLSRSYPTSSGLSAPLEDFVSVNQKPPSRVWGKKS